MAAVLRKTKTIPTRSRKVISFPVSGLGWPSKMFSLKNLSWVTANCLIQWRKQYVYGDEQYYVKTIFTWPDFGGECFRENCFFFFSKVFKYSCLTKSSAFKFISQNWYYRQVVCFFVPVDRNDGFFTHIQVWRLCRAEAQTQRGFEHGSTLYRRLKPWWNVCNMPPPPPPPAAFSTSITTLVRRRWQRRHLKRFALLGVSSLYYYFLSRGGE